MADRPFPNLPPAVEVDTPIGKMWIHSMQAGHDPLVRVQTGIAGRDEWGFGEVAVRGARYQFTMHVGKHDGAWKIHEWTDSHGRKQVSPPTIRKANSYTDAAPGAQKTIIAAALTAVAAWSTSPEAPAFLASMRWAALMRDAYTLGNARDEAQAKADQLAAQLADLEREIAQAANEVSDTGAEFPSE